MDLPRVRGPRSRTTNERGSERAIESPRPTPRGVAADPPPRRGAGAYEIGEDNGLDALAAAVETELNATAGKRRVRCVVSAGGASFEVSAYEGTSLYDVVRRGAKTVSANQSASC